MHLIGPTKEDCANTRSPYKTLLKVMYESGGQESYHKAAHAICNGRKRKEEGVRKGIHPLMGEGEKKE